MDQKRRNLLSIIGLSGGVMLVTALMMKKRNLQKFSWEGYALGADSSIQAYGTDEQEFNNVIEDAVSLISHLESIFSLYDSTSEILRLNEIGYLDNASQCFPQEH